MGRCLRAAAPTGGFIITVPSSIVDRLLAILKFMRFLDGMSFEEHMTQPSTRPATGRIG